jgi:hypothetical protein
VQLYNVPVYAAGKFRFHRQKHENSHNRGIGMEPLHIVAFISFVSGALGYIILKFWIRPILGYRKLKRRILSDLRDIDSADSAERTAGSEQKNKWKTAIRKHGAELTDHYNYDLPRWYRIVLQQRGENPIEAAKHLLKLPGTPGGEDAKRTMEKIKEYLIIK